MAEAKGHSPQGECGLKFLCSMEEHYESSHSPQGECGLKYNYFEKKKTPPFVTPRKGSVD